MSSTDRRTDGQTDKVNPVYPPSNFVGQGYKKAHRDPPAASVAWLDTKVQIVAITNRSLGSPCSGGLVSGDPLWCLTRGQVSQVNNAYGVPAWRSRIHDAVLRHDLAQRPWQPLLSMRYVCVDRCEHDPNITLTLPCQYTATGVKWSSVITEDQTSVGGTGWGFAAIQSPRPNI